MPRAKQGNAPTAIAEQRALLWLQTGDNSGLALYDWDADGPAWLQACMEIVASGATLVIRPGSGGRSVGVAIWEGDVRHPPKWCYDDDELTTWARGICDISQGRRRMAAD